ncbi:hypothetical protein [Wolbachia endosymbiont of Ctenocephalides felis wCfeT]|uniref:hypothetical protein n=1 Tax=Wolbachia endosymbiont of Ctenocephalides felis wCfeT TaxID=2732593 RepID=UPI001446A8BD|nr:hypothetical protein [Wolbachia endosymbiont of Ctenocephalides felis wCfeT]
MDTSYFTQSKRGNMFLERIISLYLTWRQKKLNPFQNLLYCFLSHTPEWIRKN